MSSWYEIVPSAAPITQGDLILDCPVLSWRDDHPLIESPKDAETLTLQTSTSKADVIVMTQACDLAQAKVRNVILCPHFSIDEYRSSHSSSMGTKEFENRLKKIRDGLVWNLAMLDGHSTELELAPRIVDFHEVLSLPRTSLESFAAASGQARLRLLPPYREHISQAFARFFMRVGLPSSIRLPGDKSPAGAK